MTEFTVEASAGNRLSVSWEDSQHTLHFNAEIVGDKMGVVLNKHSSPRGEGTVFKRRKEGGRGSFSYPSATDPAYAPIIAEARAKIDAGGLITKAVQARADRLAEIERERTKAKAASVREALAEFGLSLDEHRSAEDAELAKVYDRIQNSCA